MTIRGDRDSSWLVVRRALAIVRRLLRGPATKYELLHAVRADVGPGAYNDAPPAAELALKRDRAALKQPLGIEVAYDRRAGLYCLASLGCAAWLDLPDDAYDNMGDTFDSVWQWIEEHGDKMDGAPRDVVLVGPNDTSDVTAYRTEIVYPVTA